MTLRLAVFASGGGTNFQALLDHQRPGGGWEIVLLLTDRAEAGALGRAARGGVATAVVPTKGRDLAAVGDEMLGILDAHAVDAILLAGYLKLVPPAVVARYPRRIVNIHPALLPAFGGKGMYGINVHRAVIEAGEAWSGATVHFVDEEYDRGRILAQRRVPVRAGDTPEALAARVLEVEHRLYPEAVDHFCAALAAGTEPGPMEFAHHTTEGAAMKRALLSVSDKNGIVAFGRALVERGWELLSTGGTARTLKEAGLAVTKVADVTKHPEMMDGRVKTLHPAIHAGLLARRSRPDDLAALEEHGYAPIDLVAVNLYPFRETVAKGDVTVDDAMEQVDIGGPTMIRSSAKSHRDVCVVVDPMDYDAVIAALDGPVEDFAALRRRLAAKAFEHTSSYDASITGYLSAQDPEAEIMPATLVTSLHRVQTLRYGENPDQQAAFYGYDRPAGLAALRQHHGRELSYNNLLDLDGALLSLQPFVDAPGAAVCIIKHTTPCGIGVGASVEDAYRKALATDPVSAFGSAIAVSRPVDDSAAAAMSELFIECVVAPSFTEQAMSTLTKKKNVRLLTFPEGDAAEFVGAYGSVPEPRMLRSVYGGMLAQTPPVPPCYGRPDPSWTVATRRQPTEAEWDDLRFAWSAIFGVKSNAILLAKGGAVLGIGAGQMSRVDSSKIAVRKAGEAGHALAGSVLASDAFFPFRDGVDAAAEAGVKAVVQPGGSVRDEEVVGAANEHGIAMVFTGRRLFRH